MLDGFWPDFLGKFFFLCEELEKFWILLFDHLALKFSHSFRTSAYFYLIVQFVITYKYNVLYFGIV